VVPDKERALPGKNILFSSNYELYASMSARVMSCLEELAPRVEQYSIDEMFLDLTGVEHCMDSGGLRPAAAPARV
jgi:DNA polymerase V